MNAVIAISLGMILGSLMVITYQLDRIFKLLRYHLWNIQEDTRTTNWILKIKD